MVPAGDFQCQSAIKRDMARLFNACLTTIHPPKRPILPVHHRVSPPEQGEFYPLVPASQVTDMTFRAEKLSGEVGNGYNAAWLKNR